VKVTITIQENPESRSNAPGFIVSSNFPMIECTALGEQLAEAMNEIRGSCLCAIGLFKVVPNVIEFEVRDLTIKPQHVIEEERRSKFSNISPGVGNRKTDV